MSKTRQLQQWQATESRLTKSRNDLCIRGANAADAIRFYEPEQKANDRRYKGIMRGLAGRLTVH